jgi:hypothetical protein
VKLWSDAENRRHLGPTPEALGNTLKQIQLQHREHPMGEGFDYGRGISLEGLRSENGMEIGLDLVAMGIHAIGRLFENI